MLTSGQAAAPAISGLPYRINKAATMRLQLNPYQPQILLKKPYQLY
jgi:hypothetical protein